MARAWLDLGPDPAWGRIQVAKGEAGRLGYVTAEIRGAGSPLLRLAEARLERAELLRVPGQG